MAVIYPESVECLSERVHVRCHVLPQPRVVGWLGPISQLDAVTPDDYLTAEISFGWKERKILQRVSVPYPTIVGERVYERIGAQGGG